MLELIIIFNIIFSVSLSMVYFYLYRQHWEKYMGLWSLSWLLFGVRIGFDLLRFIGYTGVVLIIINQLLAISSTFILLLGMYVFSNKRLSKWWFYIAAMISILAIIELLLKLPLAFVALPTVLYIGLAQIWTGVVFLRLWEIKGLGKYISGYSLILIGLFNYTYPLTTIYGTQATILFYSVALLLWVSILMGILMVYYEKMSKELSVNEKRFRLLAENAKDIIYRINLEPNLQLEYISPSLYTITGYSPDELYQAPQIFFEILDEKYHSLIKDLSTDSDTKFYPSEVLIRCKSGKEIWLEQHTVPIYDQGKSIVALEGIARDISGRKKMETEMARLDQMKILGETAAGIAHEIRNPMTTVRGFLQMLMPKDDLKSYGQIMEIMITELDRANSIITDFLSLSNKKVSILKKQNLNKIIETLKPLLENNAFVSSKFIVFNLAETPKILLDEKEIKQVLLNLVQNGLDAMNTGGTLEVSTYSEEEFVILTVKDQGSGISPEILDDLGNPFVTSKENGTGLGLAVCYSIAARHEANITFETAANGTTFYIKFKAAPLSN